MADILPLGLEQKGFIYYDNHRSRLQRVNTEPYDGGIMVFNSLQYLIFFPAVLLLFYAVPQKMKNAWLLIASYVFYGLWNAKYCLLLFICTLITYAAARIISATAAGENTAPDTVRGETVRKPD